MRRLRANFLGVKLLSSVPKSAKKSLENEKFASYYIYYEKEGMVNWLIENKTDEDKYVSLYRGTVLKDHTIPFYILGSEFAEVYFAKNESSFINSLGDLRLHTLAILHDGSYSQIGAVFYLPARGVIRIPEFGYEDLEQLIGEVLEVKCVGLDFSLVFYDYTEITDYGHKIFPPHDPYAIETLKFFIHKIGWMPTYRYIVPVKEFVHGEHNIITESNVIKNSL